MKYLTFAASLSKESFNKKLIQLVNKKLEENNQSFSTLDLNDYLLMSYNGDIEEHDGFPKKADELKTKIDQAQALIISSPEYNFSMPGHFKNTFDWISRYRPIPWAGKKLLLLSASPSLIGGNRGLWSLRVPFEAVGCFVYPEMFSLASAHEAFDSEGRLNAAIQDERLSKFLRDFMNFVGVY